VKLDKEKQKEEKLVAKAVKEALAKQERIRIAKQKEINRQVKAEAKKQGVLDKVAARKDAIAIKKAAISAKPSKIVILHVKSSILQSLGSYEEVVVENPVLEAIRVVRTTKLRRQITLPQRLRNK
jgi:hypothetical protein